MRELNRNLQSQGLEGKFDLSLNEKRQWYKPDGTPLPVLLPTDEYNRKVFQGRGWTLTPPRAAAAAPIRSVSPIEQEIQRAREKLAAKTQGSGPITQEVQREIAGKVKDKMAAAAPAGNGLNFLPSALASAPGVGMPCAESGCEYCAQGTPKEQARRMDKHLYGAFSKHKKEKN